MQAAEAGVQGSGSSMGESQRSQPLPPALGSEIFTPKAQGQMVSSAERHGPVKTGSGGKDGAGDPDLREQHPRGSRSDGRGETSQRES